MDVDVDDPGVLSLLVALLEEEAASAAASTDGDADGAGGGGGDSITYASFRAVMERAGDEAGAE